MQQGVLETKGNKPFDSYSRFLVNEMNNLT